MSSEQLRYNAGKPRLTYFYANARALAEVDYSGAPDYFTAQQYIIDYLSGGPRKSLALAAGCALKALERELGGQLLWSPVFGQLLRLAPDAMCNVSVFGAAKYGDGNYRKGAPVRNYLDSGLRHLRDIAEFYAAIPDPVDGSVVCLDSESKQPHGAHLAWNLVMALDQPDFRDDRLPPVAGSYHDRRRSGEALPLTAPAGILDGTPEFRAQLEREERDHQEALLILRAGRSRAAEAPAVPELPEPILTYADLKDDCDCDYCDLTRRQSVEFEINTTTTTDPELLGNTINNRPLGSPDRGLVEVAIISLCGCHYSDEPWCDVCEAFMKARGQ